MDSESGKKSTRATQLLRMCAFYSTFTHIAKQVTEV